MASRVLAIWCMDWPAVAAAATATARDGSGRRHAGQPGDRLLIGCPFGRGAARAATTRGVGPLSAPARGGCRLRPRRSFLRRGYRGGGRRGASRRGTASWPDGVAGTWGGPVFRVRAAGRRAADRCGGRSRRRVSGRGSRSAVHRGLRRPCRPCRAAGEDARFLSALSIRQLATEPSLSGPGRADLGDLLWRMGIRTIGQFAALSRTDVASGSGPTR